MTPIRILMLSALALIGCKPNAGSTVMDLATADTMKTGFFLPRAEGEESRVAARYRTKEEIARIAGIELEAAYVYRVSGSDRGESILLIERAGMLPTPVVSIDAQGKVSQWSFVVLRDKQGNQGKFDYFVRHERGQEPKPSVNAAGTETNIYLRRRPFNRDGIFEPVLVSWLNHLQTEGGNVLYRVGNVVLNARGDVPVIGFNEVGNQVWTMTGSYRDADVAPGAVFWSPDLKTYYSVAPKLRRVVEWRRQDDNSMDRVGVKADVKMPKLVSDTLAHAEAQGHGTEGKALPILGTPRYTAAKGVIALYPSKQSLAGTSPRSRLALAGDPAGERDDGFYERPWQRQRPRAAFSLTDPNVTHVISPVNGYDMTVREVSRTPVFYANNSMYAWTTGVAETRGTKIMYERLTADGTPTGQFVEINNVPAMGMFGSAYSEQRDVSLRDLAAESGSARADDAEALRLNNARIAEERKLADANAASADFFAAETEKKVKQFPAKGLNAIAQGYLPADTMLPWKVAASAGGNAGAQVANIGLDYATDGAVGQEDFNYSQVAGAGFGSYLGNSVNSVYKPDLGAANSGLLASLFKTYASKGTETVASVVSEAGNPEGPAMPNNLGERSLIAAQDGAIDAAIAYNTYAVPPGHAKAAIGFASEAAKPVAAFADTVGASGAEAYHRQAERAGQVSSANMYNSHLGADRTLEYLRETASSRDSEDQASIEAATPEYKTLTPEQQAQTPPTSDTYEPETSPATAETSAVASDSGAVQVGF